MGHPPGLWREQLLTDADAVSETQQSDIVPTGDRWFCRRISVINDTSLNADCQVSIETASYNHLLHRFRQLPANEMESEDLSIWLHEGERLRFAWTDVISGDRLQAFITGIKRYGRDTVFEEVA